MELSKKQQKQVEDFKTKYYKEEKDNPGLLKKPPKPGWKFIMSREAKRFRSKWNTEKKPYEPTPKGDPRAPKKEEKKKDE